MFYRSKTILECFVAEKWRKRKRRRRHIPSNERPQLRIRQLDRLGIWMHPKCTHHAPKCIFMHSLVYCDAFPIIFWYSKNVWFVLPPPPLGGTEIVHSSFYTEIFEIGGGILFNFLTIFTWKTLGGRVGFSTMFYRSKTILECFVEEKWRKRKGRRRHIPSNERPQLRIRQLDRLGIWMHPKCTHHAPKCIFIYSLVYCDAFPIIFWYSKMFGLFYPPPLEGLKLCIQVSIRKVFEIGGGILFNF